MCGSGSPRLLLFYNLKEVFMDKDNWVDFKVVKQAVTMQMVLEHYGINWLRKNKAELRGRCPIHKGEGERAFQVIH